MLHAKETGISSSCLDLWPMCTISLLLNILNVILNLSKYESQSHQLAVWSLRSEVCRLSSADCEVCSLSSAFCGGLQVEFCSLRPTVWGLQSEVCMSSSAASEHWGLQSELCSLHSNNRLFERGGAYLETTMVSVLHKELENKVEKLKYKKF